MVESERGTKEKARVYEIGGQGNVERHHIYTADAVILVYDLTDPLTFSRVREIKRKVGDAFSTTL